MQDFETRFSSLYLRGVTGESESPELDTNQKTFIIFGVPRGGTTMVARVAAKLGVALGSELPTNYEDEEFNYDRMPDDLKGDPKLMAQSLLGAINRRNIRHDVWGWKYPLAHRYLPLIIKQVRNPHLICVQRDAVASSLRPLSRKNFARLPTEVIKQRLQWQIKNIEQIQKFNLPTFLCSYEKAVFDPVAFVTGLASFIELRDDEQSLAAALEQIRPGGYIKD